MHRRRVTSLVALACAALPLGFACDDDDARGDAAPGVDAGAEEALSSDAPAVLESGTGADSGVFSVVDVVDTPCATRGGSVREVFPAPAELYAPRGLMEIGARRAMLLDEGFVLFDADGANVSQPSQPSFSVTSIATSKSALFALGPDGKGLSAVRYDAAGAVSAGKIAVAASPEGFGAGGGAGSVLAAWIEGSTLRARGFLEDGTAAGPPFFFRQGLNETSGGSFAVVHADGEEYGVAFVGERDDTHRFVFTRVDTTERVGTSWTLLVGNEPLRLLGATHTKSGFAVVLQRRAGATPVEETLLVLLDTAGRIDGQVRRLVGVRRAFGLAETQGELAVLAWRSGAGAGDNADAIELRPFATSGEPLGPWVCLDQPLPAPNLDVGAAILGEDDGYSVAMRSATKSIALVRVGKRGTEP